MNSHGGNAIHIQGFPQRAKRMDLNLKNESKTLPQGTETKCY